MAIIYSYSNENELRRSDKLVGTATTLHNGKVRRITKNFTIGELSDFINGGDIPSLTLTTDGTSGAATLIDNVLNIPIYSGSGSIPTLQEVTDEGNETTNALKVFDSGEMVAELSKDGERGRVTVKSTGIGGDRLDLDPDSVTVTNGVNTSTFEPEFITYNSTEYPLPTGTSSQIATLNDIPSLTGYATETWVGNNYYPLSSNPAGYLTISTLPIPTLQQTTDTGNTTTNEINSYNNINILGNYGFSVSQGYDFGFMSKSAVGVSNALTGAEAFLFDGTLGLQSALGFQTSIKADYVVNGGVIYQLPNKTVGTYTLATTADIPSLTGYVPTTRTLTINGTTYDLSSNRSWTISGTSPLTTKGDLYTFSTVDARLPVGLDTQVLIADSTTPTGLKWGSNTAPTQTGYYGAWQDNVTQTAAANNTGYAMIFRTIDISNGVSVVTNGTNLTRITFANTGVYNLQFSSQFQNLSNSPQDVTIWLRLNGVDVPGSAGIIGLEARKNSGDPYHIVTGWNYLLNVVAGQYYELVWSTTDHTNVQMQYYAAGSPPPSAASVIMTVTQQSGIMAGTGITAINSLTGAVQTLTTGTSGTDFGISSTGTTHTFNLPTASATNRGALSSTDWSTFNSKQNSLGFTPYKYLNTTQVVHTGTLSETAVATATIVGSTFNTNDVMKQLYKLTKGITLANANVRIRINTSNTLSGATQIAIYTFTTANLFLKMKRDYDLSSGNLYGIGFNANLVTDDTVTSASNSSTTYNTANTLYVFFTVQLGNILDSITFNMANITN